MEGQNLGQVYENHGYSPKMGLGEAKEKAEGEPISCPLCHESPDSLLRKVVILRYGLCLNCAVEENRKGL